MDDYVKFLDELPQHVREQLEKITENTDDGKMNEFKEIIHEFCSVAEKYSHSMDDLNRFVATNTKRIEFGIQSKCLHRGYYCPSPIIDLLVNGTKRGKLTKALRKTTKECYQYNFDENDHMLSIEHYYSYPHDSMHETEFIIKENDVEYGVTFQNEWMEVSQISKVVYNDDLVQSYTSGGYHKSLSTDYMSFDHEEYFYTGTILTRAVVYFNVSPALNLYDKYECIIRYDDDGEILEFDVTSDY